MKFSRLTKVLFAAMAMVIVSSCDVHEFPDPPQYRPHVLKLSYDTDFPVWNNDYSLKGGVVSKGEVHTKSVMKSGMIRYVIRTYPLNRKNRSANDYVQEFVFAKDIYEGYNSEFVLELLPGEWRIMVWSDLMRDSDDEPFYDYTDFDRIKLVGKEHRGNTDYRDAFRGYADLVLKPLTMEGEPGLTEVQMERPLAKFEFLTTDLKDFIINEQTKADKLQAETKGGEGTKASIDLNDYNIVIRYSGFMPNTFSMAGDKAVDSETGASFRSSITRISDTEASIGFDYVFVNHKQTAVSVQVGLYNKAGEQISLSNPIEVPLKRNHHTLLKGTFLTLKASGGLAIDPEFDGDHNIIL